MVAGNGFRSARERDERIDWMMADGDVAESRRRTAGVLLEIQDDLREHIGDPFAHKDIDEDSPIYKRFVEANPKTATGGLIVGGLGIAEIVRYLVTGVWW